MKDYYNNQYNKVDEKEKAFSFQEDETGSQRQRFFLRKKGDEMIQEENLRVSVTRDKASTLPHPRRSKKMKIVKQLN